MQGLASDADNLVVRIFSFSFHRGLPKDESGNGGGFVFDGRSLPNPGREERFKRSPGRDAPVIDYLNQQESVHQFLASVMSLVDASVNNYQQRGFKNLMVSFGCTGGQHRSVYLAEQVAKRLQGRNGVEVVVRHRELERLEAEKAGTRSEARRQSEPELERAKSMKAMILAAGLGTRLAPAHQRSSESAGRSRRPHTAGNHAASLAHFGVREVIVNVHHFADMVIDYLKMNDNFGMRIEISREEVLLDTGGGLKKAAWFFLEGQRLGRAVPAAQRGRAQRDRSSPDAAISSSESGAGHARGSEAESSRYLLFDARLQLCGRRAGRDRGERNPRAVREPEPLAFSGIHVISPGILKMIERAGRLLHY